MRVVCERDLFLVATLWMMLFQFNVFFLFTTLFFSFLSALYSTQVLAITVVFGFSLLIGSSIRQQIWEKESQNAMVNVFFSMDI